MAGRRTLNERRLTRRQIEELVASGATLRQDMTAALQDSLPQSSVYELPGDRFLLVFGELGLGGKGDVYAADVFHRFLRVPYRFANGPPIASRSSIRSMSISNTSGRASAGC
jgi:hypothetical protein